jgi:hypothetical protein
MNERYYFDDAAEHESLWRFYTFVIRDRRREGWVFRFGPLDEGHAGEVLRNLNYPWPKRVAA